MLTVKRTQASFNQRAAVRVSEAGIKRNFLKKYPNAAFK